jgi:general secretion pathway protein G
MDTQKQRFLRRARRARARGLTLVELMIVITLIGALMSVIAIGIFSKLASGEKKTACMGAKNIAGEVKLYKRDHPDVDCPTADMLKATASKGDKVEVKDPWGKPYDIKCDGEDVVVISGGPSKGQKPADAINSDTCDAK